MPKCTDGEAYSVATYNRYLTIAFQVDVENFLLKFEELKSLKFSDFATIWKEMKFSYINSEQQYYTFIRQFVDNCFFILKKFIVFPKNIYTSTGAIYLMYALYFKQIVNNWVKIRITQYEYMKLQDLIEQLRKDEQIEPLYCYGKLVTSNAFEYVFQKKPLAPEAWCMKNLSDYTDDTFQVTTTMNSGLKLKDVLNKDNFLESFTKVTTEYNDALKKFSVNNVGLGIFESNIIQDINATLNSFENKKEEAHNSMYDRRKEIRDRAMTTKNSTRYSAVAKEESEISIDEDWKF
ncbi:hypothetical protein HHI36_021526 [Cryptolaemus montrouzieri]|uniref:Uncharacterized protein n=1 Tax=Cryptolaemus montrouzieri TaxID=559131 RepID=A0ABD2MX77_9CUCU